MNKEKAIDILANCIDDYVIGDFCVGKFCPMENECKDKECVFHLAIETVLNLIEKQQAEIEDLKKSVDYTYEAYQDAGKKMFDYAEEVEKKDKIINKMAEQLTTPYHSKEDVIDYYKKEIENENTN